MNRKLKIAGWIFTALGVLCYCIGCFSGLFNDNLFPVQLPLLFCYGDSAEAVILFCLAANGIGSGILCFVIAHCLSGEDDAKKE